MKLKAVLLFLSFGALAACPAFASGVNFNFGGPDQTLGTSATFSSGSTTITAFGFKCSATSSSASATLSNCMTNDLFQKSDGADETGLGLAGQFHGNEIGWNGPDADFVMGLDVSSLFKLGATSMTLTFGSVESGEGFAVLGFASNPFGQSSFALSNTVASARNNGGSEVLSTTIALNAQDQFLVLISPCSGDASPSGNCGSNVTLMSLNAATSSTGSGSSMTPEPGTIALFGTGLLLIGTILRRKWGTILQS